MGVGGGFSGALANRADPMLSKGHEKTVGGEGGGGVLSKSRPAFETVTLAFATDRVRFTILEKKIKFPSVSQNQ